MVRANFEHHTIIKTHLHSSVLFCHLLIHFSVLHCNQSPPPKLAILFSFPLPAPLTLSPSDFPCHHSTQTVVSRWPVTSMSPDLMVSSQCSSFQQKLTITSPLINFSSLGFQDTTLPQLSSYSTCYSFSSLLGCFPSPKPLSSPMSFCPRFLSPSLARSLSLIKNYIRI